MDRPSLIKRLLFAVLAVALSFGVILVALEIGLRFLPVETGFSFAPVHSDAPVMHAAPDKAFVSSVGWMTLYKTMPRILFATLFRPLLPHSRSRRVSVTVEGESQ